MADTPTTPPTPPTPPRRKATTGPRKTTRATPPKVKAPATELTGAAAAVKTPSTRKAPAKRKTATRKPAATAATRAKTAAKSATSKVSTTASKAARTVAGTASSARQSVAQSKPVQLVSDTRDKMGDRNFFAALLGGAAAIGAAVGGLFYALRDGHPDKPTNTPPKPDA